MSDLTDEQDDDEIGPSLAIPPLYVLRATERCPECGRALHVYALGCAPSWYAAHPSAEALVRGRPAAGREQVPPADRSCV